MTQRMRGGIVKRGTTWSFVLRVPDETGRTHQRWVGGFPTEAAAKSARDDARVAARKGQYVDRSRQTVADYLSTWLAGHRAHVKPRTHECYRKQLGRYVVPTLGGKRLQVLRAADVSSLYGNLLTSGGMDGGPLSPRTVGQVHRVLHRAFSDAVNEGLIAVNPCDRAKAPKVQPVDYAPAWTPRQVRMFLATAAHHRLGAFYRLAVYTGARRGELLALTWDDLDLDEGLVTISKSVGHVDGKRIVGTPKSGRARTVGIDAGTIAELRRHQARQQVERDDAADLWVQTDLVFTRADGGPLHVDTPSTLMPRLCKAADLPPVRLHDLRHQHATALLTNGAPVHEVARRLGHRDGTVTLAVYAHVLAGRDAHLADAFASCLEVEPTTAPVGLRAVPGA